MRGQWRNGNEGPIVRGSKAGGRATGQRRYCYLNIVFMKQVLCHPCLSATSFPCMNFALFRRDELAHLGYAGRSRSYIYRKSYPSKLVHFSYRLRQQVDMFATPRIEADAWGSILRFRGQDAVPQAASILRQAALRLQAGTCKLRPPREFSEGRTCHMYGNTDHRS